MLELAGIIILGIIAQWIAWKLKIPAILPLILIGLFVGPISTLINEDGHKWIEPIWNGETGLFPDKRLYNFVSLSIALILFEGGMTLKKNEVKNVGSVIYKLITLGSFVTFIVAGIAAHYVIGLSWSLSLLFSALIIVTGPTVISPILRNLAIKKDVSSILKWEGILIDPIGALAAVLVLEFISVGSHDGGSYTQEALIEFGKIIVIGLSIGFTAAYAFATALKQKWIPNYLINVSALALVLGVFVLSDLFVHESGLLAVVIMGMVLGNKNIKELKDVLYFKEAISILLISMLFILLSANINMSDLALIYNWQSLLLFGIVVLIVRPIGVFLSTHKSSLKFNEKLFISWVGPRGIVAAGIASLFGLKLEAMQIEGAEYITPLVFMIVMGTVMLNATTAKLFARITKVLLEKSEGLLIIGANEPARLIAKYLQKNGRRVVMIDSNPKSIEYAQKMNLDALVCDIYSEELTENIELNDIGHLMALTGSDAVNDYAITKLSPFFGENGAHRLISKEEMRNKSSDPTISLFSATDDFINLNEVVRDYPNINEIKIKSKEHYIEIITKINTDKKAIPIFIKDNKSSIHIIDSYNIDEKVSKDNVLMYLGKAIV